MRTFERVGLKNQTLAYKRRRLARKSKKWLMKTGAPLIDGLDEKEPRTDL
jgi:hypothetical protein